MAQAEAHEPEHHQREDEGGDRADQHDRADLREAVCLEQQSTESGSLEGCRLEFRGDRPKRGVFAHISDADVEDWQSAIDIVLRRFAEYHDLQGAFGRRALTERAKGILMERHGIDEASAFEMLRE